MKLPHPFALGQGLHSHELPYPRPVTLQSMPEQQLLLQNQCSLVPLRHSYERPYPCPSTPQSERGQLANQFFLRQQRRNLVPCRPLTSRLGGESPSYPLELSED